MEPIEDVSSVSVNAGNCSEEDALEELLRLQKKIQEPLVATFSKHNIEEKDFKEALESFVEILAYLENGDFPMKDWWLEYFDNCLSLILVCGVARMLKNTAHRYFEIASADAIRANSSLAKEKVSLPEGLSFGWDKMFDYIYPRLDVLKNCFAEKLKKADELNMKLVFAYDGPDSKDTHEKLRQYCLALSVDY
jgi:hypothetical protein